MKKTNEPGFGEVILAICISASLAWNVLSHYESVPLPVERYTFIPLTVHATFKPVGDAVSLVWPIHPKDYKAVSSPYGERDPKTIGGYGDYFHNGADMWGALFARIISVLPGKVVCHFFAPDGKRRKGHSVLGGLLVIRYVDAGGTPWFIRYGHLSDTLVHEGDVVKAGELIARQGATGRTNSQHLHIEIYEGGYCDTETGDIRDYITEHNPLTLLEEPKI